MDEAERGRNRETLQVYVEDYGVTALVNEKDSAVIVDYAGEKHTESNKIFPSNELITKIALAIQVGFLKKSNPVVFANRGRLNRKGKSVFITWYDELAKLDERVYDGLIHRSAFAQAITDSSNRLKAAP